MGATLTHRSRRRRVRRDSRGLFLQQFLKHPRQVGTIVPSSRFLERRVVDLAEVRSAQTVVELGAGTGGLTREILRAMPLNAKLLSIEVNPHFCTLLLCREDPRLIVHCGNAKELREAVLRYELAAPEAVISGVPFSAMSRVEGARILETISSILVPGGRFVAYQVSRRVDRLSRPLLGPARVEVELLNIPPLRVYRWDKAAA
jgi:phospholipid N-methyltransferase